MASQHYRGDHDTLGEEERRRWRPDDDSGGFYSDRFYGPRFSGSESERPYREGPAGRPEEWNRGRPEFAGQYGNPRNQHGGGQYGNQYGTGQYAHDYRQQTEPGPHRGKGPLGWQRSDERIQEAVNEALTEHDHVDATHIQVHVKDGEVTLTGTVEDRAMKRRAEECADRVSGVKDVQNNLRLQGAITTTQDNGKQARA